MWLLIYSFLIGGGAARLAETRPLTEERVVRPPPCVRDPTTIISYYLQPSTYNLIYLNRILSKELKTAVLIKMGLKIVGCIPFKSPSCANPKDLKLL